MRKSFIYLALLFVLCSCASSATTLEYQSVGAVKLTVDTAMNIWADRVATGNTTATEQSRVKAAFEAYTALARSAAAVMRSSSSTAPPDVQQSANALLNLLASFGVVAPQPSGVTP